MIRLGEVPSNDNLVCFLAAAEYLNFRRAAAVVALTPTAFGQRIRQLEEQVGKPLFERTTRRVALTAAGALLVPVARKTLESARDCLAAVHHDAPPVTFVLGSRYELAQSWLAPAIASLSESHPHWNIHMYCGSGDDIIGRLRAGDVDCIVTSAPMARSGWAALFLHPETYALVGAPALLADRPLETEADCQAHTLLDVNASLPLARYVLSAEGPVLNFGNERYLGSGGAMLELTLAGQGVAVLPTYMVSAHLQSGSLVRLLPNRPLLADTFRLIHKVGAPLTASFGELAGILRERALS